MLRTGQTRPSAELKREGRTPAPVHSSEKLTAVLLVVAILGAVGFALLASVTVGALQSSRREVLRSRAFMENLNALVDSFHQTRTAARGYAISGQDAYLAEFPAEVQKTRDSLNRLETSENIGTVPNAQRLRLITLIKTQLAAFESWVRLRRERGEEDLEAVVFGGESRRLDDEIARIAEDLESDERTMVNRQRELVDQHARRTFILLVVAAVGNLLLVTAVFLILRRELRAREAISAQLSSEGIRIQHLLSESQSASADLERSQQLFRMLFENSPDAMVLVDPQRRIARANTRAHELFGWEPGKLKGQLLESLLPDRFHMHHVAHLADYFRTPRARPMGQGLELFGMRKDQTEFPVDIMLSPMDLEEGLQVLAVIRDITQRRQAQVHIQRLNEDLQQRAADLEYANKELEAFSYSVSHDLRAPLRHINGFSDMLKTHIGSNLDDKGQRYLETIVEAAKRMGMLIDDLLMFSRMGRSEMVRQPIDLAMLTEEVRRGVERDTAVRPVRWTVASLPEVRGDVAMLRQVMFNLLSNAVKYSRHREEPLVEIGTVPSGPGEVVFFVRDNGAGFDMKYAHKLFGVFQRLHGATEFEGTGVGLAIVRRIVQRHGGRTWAEGAVEQGATFYFSLPVQQG